MPFQTMPEDGVSVAHHRKGSQYLQPMIKGNSNGIEEEIFCTDCSSKQLTISNSTLSSSIDSDDVQNIIKEHHHPLKVKSFIIEEKPIRQLPVHISELKNLKKLVLRGTELEDLPWSIIYLKQLTELDISFNHLQCLPRTIGYLPSLEVLFASNNRITFIPAELLKLRKLRRLDLEGNPLVSPPPQVVELGVQPVFEYLRKRKERKNLFENFTPWITNTSACPLTSVPSLFELCVKRIVDCGVEFLTPEAFPPRLKLSISQRKKMDEKLTFISKCSSCRKYYSNKFLFESHHCYNQTLETVGGNPTDKRRSWLRSKRQTKFLFVKCT